MRFTQTIMVKLSSLTIKDEYKNLIPPLSKKERSTLKASIKQEGVRDAIKVLDQQEIFLEGYVIIDGHNRFEIAQELGIEQVPIQVADTSKINESDLSDKIRTWMFQEQIGRRNMSDFQKVATAIVATKHIEEKAKTNKANSDSTGGKIDRLKIISELSGIGRTKVAQIHRIIKFNDKKIIQQIEDSDLSINSAYKMIQVLESSNDELKKQVGKLSPTELHKQLQKPIQKIKPEAEQKGVDSVDLSNIAEQNQEKSTASVSTNTEVKADAPLTLDDIDQSEDQIRLTAEMIKNYLDNRNFVNTVVARTYRTNSNETYDSTKYLHLPEFHLRVGFDETVADTSSKRKKTQKGKEAKQHRSIDVLHYVNPYRMTSDTISYGYEIKVDKSDLTNDLKIPDYLLYCDYFYLVVSSELRNEAILKADELKIGLVICKLDGSLEIIRDAQKREIEINKKAEVATEIALRFLRNM